MPSTGEPRTPTGNPLRMLLLRSPELRTALSSSGLASAGLEGLIPSSSNPVVSLPQPKDLPDAVAAALKELRLAGVEGPYALLLSAELWTAVAETTDDGYPIRKHIDRLLDGEVLWAPAIQGAVLLSTRGGDV